MDGTATTEEKTANWGQIQSIVKRVLLDTPPGAIELTVVDSYDFPAELEQQGSAH